VEEEAGARAVEVKGGSTLDGGFEEGGGGGGALEAPLV